MVKLVEVVFDVNLGQGTARLMFNGQLRVENLLDWNGIGFSSSPEVINSFRNNDCNVGFGGTLYQTKHGSPITLKHDMFDNERTITGIVSPKNESTDPSYAIHAVTFTVTLDTLPPTWGRSII